ncbi:uncharacterized protein F58A4.6-like [Uranotaenia lowii]|uniref:uncharacterized protein F58A4.6-like n=1 Tax=Uranotaenia lowii TaxID=190385 RepID=UPI002479715D|nr:uncharacterized protein F58A4.6-like [Uranotaenia lowii]XP_055611956.1 uncharacterized protein F58A4.6-like [Uranotaenia lowii]
MMFKFYIVDYTSTVEQYRIIRNGLKKRTQDDSVELRVYKKEKVLTVDTLQLNRFLVNLYCFIGFRLKVAQFLKEIEQHEQYLAIRTAPPSREPLDYKWGERANRMMWERIELDEMMSWLSTLGGAFSALGDYKLACADVAGRISIQQMQLAKRLGEPTVIERCRLYMAIAMIQKYNFAGAKELVQQVYRKAKRETEPDTRLLKMCLGIWSKLSYEYDLYQRRLNRPKI